MKYGLTWLVLCFSFSIDAAELYLIPSKTPIGELPSRFIATTNGKGLPAEWKVIRDVLPSSMARVSPLAKENRQKVIGQFSTSNAHDRYALLLYDQSFDDFEMSVQTRILGGNLARHLGIVFRYQDPQNYYSFRLDEAGGWYYFRKVVSGEEQEPIGNRIELSPGEWHTLSIQCEGSGITLNLDKQHALPVLNDTQFTEGKIGFWIQADTLAHFGGARIRYQPKRSPAQRLVDHALQKYNRLIGVSLYVSKIEDAPPRVVASHLKQRIGMAADDAVLDVISRGKIYYAKTQKTAIVTLPIKDRNGEPVAACRVELKRFRGQTQNNAIVRAMPVIRMIEASILDRIDFFK